MSESAQCFDIILRSPVDSCLILREICQCENGTGKVRKYRDNSRQNTREAERFQSFQENA